MRVVGSPPPPGGLLDVVIPGNPGLAEFYGPFVQGLLAQVCARPELKGNQNPRVGAPRPVPGSTFLRLSEVLFSKPVCIPFLSRRK